MDSFAAGPLEWAAAASLLLFAIVICASIALAAINGVLKARRESTSKREGGEREAFRVHR